MMLNFPQIHEDELFYSIVARYRNLNGIRLDCDLKLELGLPNRFKSHALLNCSISSIINHLPPSAAISQEQIIAKNTIYPYLSCLLDSNDSDLLKQNFLNSNSGSMLNRRIINRGVDFNEFLKFCPICLKEQQLQLGECYFKSIWQVPGVLICNEHDIFLIDSHIRVSNNEGYHYFTLDDEVLYKTKNEEIIRMNKWYCELVKSLFSGLYLEIDYIVISNFIKYQLGEYGYISKCGKFNRELFIEDFVRYYGIEYLDSINCNPLKSNSWLRNIYSNKKDWCVVHHLLMFQYFECNIQDAIDFKNSTRSSCNNVKIKSNKLEECILTNLKAEVEYHRKSILQVIITKEIFDVKQIEQVIPESIRYLKQKDDKWISQILNQSAQDINKNTMSHRLQWIKLLLAYPNKGRKELAKHSNKTYTYLLNYDTEWFNTISPSKRFKEINRVYNLHYNEVVQYIKNNPNCTRKSLKTANPTAYKFMVKHYKDWIFETIPISRNRIDDDGILKLKHREKLKSKLKDVPNVTRNDLILMLPSTYKYLKRNDGEWLENILPNKVKKNKPQKQVDWTNQNNDYIERCNQAIHRITLSHNKPVRITRKKVLIEAGLGNLLSSKKSRKYQILFEYLDSQLESVDTFRERKIKWAIQELIRENKPLFKTTIYKMCSIRKFEKAIDDFIDRIIEENINSSLDN